MLVLWPFTTLIILGPIESAGYRFGIGTPVAVFFLGIASLIVGVVLLTIRLIVIARVARRTQLSLGVVLASFFGAVLTALLTVAMLFRSNAACHDDSISRSGFLESFAMLVSPVVSEGGSGTAVSVHSLPVVRPCGAFR